MAASTEKVSSSELTFTTSSWNKPQTVTVIAINDTLQEGRHAPGISHSLTSSDSKYKKVRIPAVDVRVADNDQSAESLLFVNRGDSGGYVLIADFHRGRVETQYREDWGQSPLLGGWHDTNDLQYTADFMGIGNDQVLFINNSGSGGRILIVDYQDARPVVRFWENWASSGLRDGWHEAEDLVFSGRFV